MTYELISGLEETPAYRDAKRSMTPNLSLFASIYETTEEHDLKLALELLPIHSEQVSSFSKAMQIYMRQLRVEGFHPRTHDETVDFPPGMFEIGKKLQTAISAMDNNWETIKKHYHFKQPRNPKRAAPLQSIAPEKPIPPINYNHALPLISPEFSKKVKDSYNVPGLLYSVLLIMGALMMMGIFSLQL